MVLRIEQVQLRRLTMFILSGNLDKRYASELQRLFGPSADYSTIVLDLSDLRLADRAAVWFLARCEERGIRLQDCPGYIREWITMVNARIKQQSIDEEMD